MDGASAPHGVDQEIEAFWVDAKVRAGLNPARVYTGPNAADSLRPPAWSFGADPTQADRLLGLVLAGTKTATASALRDYDADGDAVPEAGDLSILLDGSGRARALIRVTSVRLVAFRDVDAAHARAEGEGDLSLGHWRDTHRRFFSEHAASDRGFRDDMPVVLERFEVVVPGPARPGSPRMSAPRTP